MKTPSAIRLVTGFVLVSALLLAGDVSSVHGAESLPPVERAAWMQQARWGVMVHYLADWKARDHDLQMNVEQWNQLVDGFDAEGLADQVKSTGAGYLILTIGQNSGYYLAPNPTYDRLTGTKPSKCSRRDLMSDMSVALRKRNLKLIAYLPSGAPNGDRAASETLQWQNGAQPNKEFQPKWEQVIRDWSVRWGDRIDGWWFDGCYWPNTMYRSKSPPNFESFATAARAGNPQNAVAFNPGVIPRLISVSPDEDYTAGEISDLATLSIRRSADGKLDGKQIQVLSYLGNTWGGASRALPTIWRSNTARPFGRRVGRSLGMCRCNSTGGFRNRLWFSCAPLAARSNSMTIETTDVLIVGAGACGSLVAKELASRGFSVVVLEAGKRFNSATDFANTEANAGKIMWTEPRVYTGKDAIVPKAGVGVGGGTLVWLGVAPRFHRNDFRTYATEGVGADWPISYDDLRPHYEKIEREFGVAGECGPFAPEQYQLPMPPHRMNWHGQVLAHGARKLGAKPFAPPMAINSTNYDGRPACCYCGWCGSGCPTGAKATASGSYLAQAEKLGARIISEVFVQRVNYDAKSGRVTGVNYLDANRNEYRVDAKLVVLAGHALETPRLLLLSTNNTFPDGLANPSGLVGKNFMSHPTWQVLGTFDEPINAFKGMQMGHVMVQDYYQPDSRNDYARGYVLISYMMTPVTFGNLSGLSYGAEYKQMLHEYAHTAAWWAHAEGLPDERNTITLDPDRKDARGLPVARVNYEWGENDVKLAAAARDKAAEMMSASGARKVRIGLNYGAHAMGSCRMGRDPKTSVVNEFGQSHDIKNLFVCDTSVFVTGAGVNPTLTAMAIASRAAEHIASSARRGEL